MYIQSGYFKIELPDVAISVSSDKIDSQSFSGFEAPV